MARNFLSGNLVTLNALAQTTANTSDVDTASYDMGGYQGIVGMLGLVASTQAISIKAQGSAASSSDGTWVDLAGTGITATTANTALLAEVDDPGAYRYVRFRVTGTTAVASNFHVIRFGAKTQAVTQTGNSEIHVWPTSGTA